ncbi:MAG: hypothetical protein OXF86_03040, partial [Caldilineaceae bacterium]|nr:hypothetical protein [Caldilineaceae bacterium]
CAGAPPPQRPLSYNMPRPPGAYIRAGPLATLFTHPTSSLAPVASTISQRHTSHLDQFPDRPARRRHASHCALQLS